MLFSTGWIGAAWHSSYNHFNTTVCCYSMLLVQLHLMMLWRKGWSMRSTRSGRRTPLSSMTWSWLMPWSGPVSPPSGCQMLPGRSPGPWHTLATCQEMAAYVLLPGMSELMKRFLLCSSSQTRGKRLQCAPAGSGDTHVRWAKSPCDCQCSAPKWWCPVWRLTLW